VRVFGIVLRGILVGASGIRVLCFGGRSVGWRDSLVIAGVFPSSHALVQNSRLRHSDARDESRMLWQSIRLERDVVVVSQSLK